MGTKRRSFSKEFKLEAVRLVIEVGDSIARVSRDLGIRSALLGRWKQEYEEDQGNAFPGKGQLKPGWPKNRSLKICQILFWRYNPAFSSRLTYEKESYRSLSGNF